MKKLYTFYRETRNGSLQLMVREDYKTKRNLESDIKDNGLRFIITLNEKEIEDLKGLTWYDNCKTINKTLYNKGNETMRDIIDMVNDYIIYEGL